MMTQPRSVLILGGGIAGMSAAKALSDSGLTIHLVEKEDRLGGKARHWACMATDECQNCGACRTAELVEETHSLANLTLYLRTELTNIARIDNQFNATLTGNHDIELTVDAVLMATGFELFDPTGFQSLGYGEHGRVITTAELNHALKTGILSQLVKNRPDPAIAFIQCVGSRNREIGRDYCSQVCCKTALRQANKLHHLMPSAQITLFHMDLQIIGKEFRTHYAELAPRIELLQGVPAEILTGHQEDKLTVIREDNQSGARRAHHFDIIVLAVGMGPSPKNARLMEMLGAEKNRWDFADESRSNWPEGVYVAGTAAAPMDILSAQAQGVAVAGRIMGDFGMPPSPKRVAVIGDGAEGRDVAQALAADNYLVMLIEQGQIDLQHQKKIQPFPEATLKGIQGTYGDFQLTLNSPQGDHTIAADAIVVANGTAKHFPSDEIGLSKGASVLALSEVDSQKLSNASRAVFWLDHSDPEWKDLSRMTLTLATALANQQKQVSVIMDKMLVHGLDGQQSYDQARAGGVKFLRITPGTRPTVNIADDGITISLKEATLPNLDLDIHCDALIISDKVAPRPENDALAHLLAVDNDREGFLQPANIRHRQVGSPRKGIFFVGSCHDESDGDDLTREINALRISLESLDHVKKGEDRLPEIREGHCVRCLTCYRICPHSAIILKAFRQPTIMPQACFSCGLCVANCPAEAITTMDVEPLPASDPIPDTVVFACQRSGALAAIEADQLNLCHQENIKLIRIPCANHLNVETLLQPLVAGSRRVLVAACHSGNCRSIVGPENASAKVTRIFNDTRLPAAMLGYRSIAANEPAAFAAMIAGDAAQEKETSND